MNCVPEIGVVVVGPELLENQSFERGPVDFGRRIEGTFRTHRAIHASIENVKLRVLGNAALGPAGERRYAHGEQEILESRRLNDPLTQYMLCSPGEGGAAVVVCRADLARRYTDKPVYVRAVTMRTERTLSAARPYLRTM